MRGEGGGEGGGRIGMLLAPFCTPLQTRLYFHLGQYDRTSVSVTDSSDHWFRQVNRFKHDIMIPVTVRYNL